jgi:hypothetical protein
LQSAVSIPDTWERWSRSASGPWKKATLFAHGTVFKDAAGAVVTEVALWELLGNDREARSPRNLATSYDRGPTCSLGGKNLADIMLLEDTDPDADPAC